ncbi:hypothetical protein TKWG_18150 [Advenella kashmirensis WT001]|uniref:Uncharacterized protein n=1 Tax=Advenella kashmirensis (strain DSM 17095 / LMG 22695 / WT001) TaxID=1036672 RepID=I3UER6_ADVKW|nr:hypothetical protein TKWG_18150 [Advenella kashmirensis WT001]
MVQRLPRSRGKWQVRAPGRLMAHQVIVSSVLFALCTKAQNNRCYLQHDHSWALTLAYNKKTNRANPKRSLIPPKIYFSPTASDWLFASYMFM